jgi:hypothetical protein
LPLRNIVLVASHRHFKVPLICETIGSNRAQIRYREVSLVHFCDPPARILSLKVNCKLDTSWDNTNLLTSDSKQPKLCCNPKSALLRNDQKVCIRRGHCDFFVSHALSAAVVVNTESVFHGRGACAHHRPDPLSKVALYVVLRRPSSLLRSHKA